MKAGAMIKCPTCGKAGPWLDGGYGPFCSERCKLADLGKWLGEEHRISSSLRPEHLDAMMGSESRPTKPDEML